MWNSKQEIIKRASIIASDKHPNGFNKSQLIEASKEVFGGFASDKSKRIETMEDVANKGNEMAFIDGHYPAGMSGCYVVGLNGDCGVECPVFHNGDCTEPQELDVDDIRLELGEEAQLVIDKYDCFN